MTQPLGEISPEQQVEGFFNSPEFAEAYAGHVAADQARGVARQQLVDNLSRSYENDSNMSKNDIAESVEDALELEDEVFDYVFSEEAVELRRAHASAADNLTQTRLAVVEAGRLCGLSQFGLYGLNTYMLYRAPDLAELQQLTTKAQADLLKVDALVRTNEGSLLTITDFSGVSATILGKDGISLTEKDLVSIPQAEGTKSFAMSFIQEEAELFEYAEGIAVPAPRITRPKHSASVLSNWSELLSTHPISICSVFATGDIVEGEPTLLTSEESADTRDFYERVYARIRRTGRAALASAE
jgi:hypothetical protein